MAPSPGDYRSDPIAGQMRGILTGNSLKLDRGEQHIDYDGTSSLPSGDAPDGMESPVEIYQAYLTLDPLSRTSLRAAGDFKKKFGVDVPWRFDRSHLPMMKSVVGMIPENASDYDKARLLLRLLRRPKAHGGFGLRYSKHTLAEGNINETIDRGFARCSEFSNIYYGAGLMLGLRMYPIEIPQVDREGNSTPHSAIMVVDGKTDERFFVDSQLKDVQSEAPYDAYYVGTTADLFSAYLHNLSMKMEGDQLVISGADDIPLLRAEEVAPHNATVLFGLGTYYGKREEWVRATEYFSRAVDANPNHMPALSSLCMLTFDPEICSRAGRPLK